MVDRTQTSGSEQIKKMNRLIDQKMMEQVEEYGDEVMTVEVKFNDLTYHAGEDVKRSTLYDNDYPQMLKFDLTGGDFLTNRGIVVIEPIKWLRARKNCKHVDWERVKEVCDDV